MTKGSVSVRALAMNSNFRTERLTVEPLTGKHANFLFPLMQDQRIYEWISSLPPNDMDKLAEVWKQRETRVSPDGQEAWLNWVVRRKSDGAFVGKLDVSVNVGYFFFPEYWGEGYATESILALTQHLAVYGVKKMIATVTMGNAASYRVLEKSGYKRTRVIKDNDQIRGVKFDDVEYIYTV
jgi:RimJ/RimL family protein N-acetyltransferase